MYASLWNNMQFYSNSWECEYVFSWNLQTYLRCGAFDHFGNDAEFPEHFGQFVSVFVGSLSFVTCCEGRFEFISWMYTVKLFFFSKCLLYQIDSTKI